MNSEFLNISGLRVRKDTIHTYSEIKTLESGKWVYYIRLRFTRGVHREEYDVYCGEEEDGKKNAKLLIAKLDNIFFPDPVSL